MQQGGALLGQGAFACTFEPAPPCAGGRVFKEIGGLRAVGKLTAEDVTLELGIGKAIMALPLASQYFSLPSASCKAGDPTLDPEAKGCRVLTEADKGTKFSLLLMPAAGQQLLRWATDLQRLSTNFERIFRHLLEGMVIYQRAGYIHNDIHMGNILMDDLGVARYIDFGLGFRVKDIQTWDDSGMGRRFRPKYVWQAPELHARRMKWNGVWLEDGLNELRHLNKEYVKMEEYFPRRTQALEALKDFNAVAPKDDGVFIREYATKFDSWRIGVCMFMLWDDLMRHMVQLPNVAAIRPVISGLTEFDPRQRLTAGQALFLLDPNSRFSEQRRAPLTPTATVQA